MAWFKRESGELDTSGEKKVRTEGLWVKCENCRQIIWKKDLEENMNVCPKCDKHFRIDARTRLAQLIDDNRLEGRGHQRPRQTDGPAGDRQCDGVLVHRWEYGRRRG